MTKYEYTEQEEFLKAAKEAGARKVGVMALVKNDDAGPVAIEKGTLGAGRRISALLSLTAVARYKDGTEDHFLHQRSVLDEVITSEAEAKAINKQLDKEKEVVYAAVQKEQLVVFQGQVKA